MRTGALLVAAGFLLAAPANAASVADKLVYKIDSVIATLAPQPCGDPGQRRGHIRRLEGRPSFVRSCARPPIPYHCGRFSGHRLRPRRQAVIQGLLPVSANVVVPMRRGVVSVRAAADANEMTTQILK